MRIAATFGIMVVSIAIAQAAPSSGSASSAPQAGAGSVIEPVIDWGKCPQLAPTDAQRKQKTEIIKACLEKHPLNQSPDQLNAEIVDKHRIELGECALTKEDWVSLWSNDQQFSPYPIVSHTNLTSTNLTISVQC